MLSLLFIAALPGYLLDLPWRCQTGERFQSGDTDSELALCHPDDKASSEAWATRISDAFHSAGLQTVRQQAPLGLHLAAVNKGRILSATFVTAPDGGFDIWLAEQIFTAAKTPPPILPAGATLLADQSDAHAHLLSIALAAPCREAEALVHATLTALGADLHGEPKTVKDGETGSIQWQGQVGFYQLRPAGPHASALIVFAGRAR